jgi:hypothetical protein
MEFSTLFYHLTVYTQTRARSQETQPHVPVRRQAHTLNKQIRDIKRGATTHDQCADSAAVYVQQRTHVTAVHVRPKYVV